MEKYTFFEDGGHGWLKVSMAELKGLGIADKITDYSYRTKDYAYLEEDSDYTTFADAWSAKHGAKWDIQERTTTHYNDTSPVRRFDRYSTREYISVKTLQVGQRIMLKPTYRVKEFILTSINPLRGESLLRTTGGEEHRGQVYRIPKNSIISVV